MKRKLFILYTIVLWSGITFITSCNKEKDNYRSVTGNVDPSTIEAASFSAYFPFESSTYVVIKGREIDSTHVVTVGTAKYLAGARGYAYQGDSTQTTVPSISYITMPLNTNAFFKDLSEFTVSCWLKRPKEQNYQEAIVLINGGDSILGTLSLTLDSLNINANVYSTSTDSVYSVSVAKTNIAEDSWTFITFTYNQTTSKLALFANGKLLNETVCLDVFSTPVGGLILSADMTTLLIGAYPQLMNGTATSSMAYFSGCIDEMRIWSKCLTADEITALYSAEYKLAKLP